MSEAYAGYLFKVEGIGEDGLGFRFFKTPDADGKRKMEIISKVCQ